MEYTHNRLDRLELVTAKKAKCKTTFLAVFLEQLHFQILVCQIAKCIEKAVCVLPKTIFIRSHTRLLKPKPIKQLNTFLYIDRHSPPNSTNFLFATSKWNNQWQVLTNDFIPLNLICNSFRITFIIFLHYHLIIFLCTSTTNKNRCSKTNREKSTQNYERLPTNFLFYYREPHHFSLLRDKNWFRKLLRLFAAVPFFFCFWYGSKLNWENKKKNHTNIRNNRST